MKKEGKTIMAKKTKANKKPVPDNSGVVCQKGRAYPVFCSVLMWAGFLIGITSLFPEFTILGISNNIIGIPAGLAALTGVFLLAFSIKCPACGSKKLGHTMGTKIPKECVCPECHAKVQLK